MRATQREYVCTQKHQNQDVMSSVQKETRQSDEWIKKSQREESRMFLSRLLAFLGFNRNLVVRNTFLTHAFNKNNKLLREP